MALNLNSPASLRAAGPVRCRLAGPMPFEVLLRRLQASRGLGTNVARRVPLDPSRAQQHLRSRLRSRPARVSAQHRRRGMSGPHIPVLGRQAAELLRANDGGIYIDGTFGAGGYSRAILAAAECNVIGIDRDPGALASGADLAKRSGGRLVLVHDQFSRLEETTHNNNNKQNDGDKLDVGVSSMQLDQAGRGFSFRLD